MADRNAFLARIREQTAKGRAHRAAINPNATHEAAYVGGGADPGARFLEEWTAVGGKGERIRGREALRDAIRRLIAQSSIRTSVCWRHPLLDRLRIGDILRDLSVTSTGWDELAAQSHAEGRKKIFAADLGITSVRFAVAETGTLALCSSPAEGRLASLLPPVYLAIIEPAQLVPDLFDLFAALEPHKHDLPSNIALVTGPSKTGDIELKLTTGVHGPGNVNVLIVEE